MKVGDYIKKITRYLILFLLITILPLSAYASSNKVYLGGESIGINVKIEGVLVSGMYEVNGRNPGSEAGLKPGDIIVKVDGKDINSIRELIDNIKDKKSTELEYNRGSKNLKTTLNLEKSEKDNQYKSGLFVKDSISGIGTLTFVDPRTKKFAALGHEILDFSTKQIIYGTDGKIYNSKVLSINKSVKGKPGGKNAKIFLDEQIGKIDKSNNHGVFGKYFNPNNKSLIEIGPYDSVKLGPAQIKTVLNGEKEEFFDIRIVKLYSKDKRPSKHIVFEITDKDLLEKTNGIVQGMSGSPIIQNGKLIGCVTHVMVNDVTKGYGIYIETLIEELE